MKTNFSYPAPLNMTLSSPSQPRGRVPLPPGRRIDNDNDPELVQGRGCGGGPNHPPVWKSTDIVAPASTATTTTTTTQSHLQKPIPPAPPSPAASFLTLEQKQASCASMKSRNTNYSFSSELSFFHKKSICATLRSSSSNRSMMSSTNASSCCSTTQPRLFRENNNKLVFPQQPQRPINPTSLPLLSSKQSSSANMSRKGFRMEGGNSSSSSRCSN